MPDLTSTTNLGRSQDSGRAPATTRVLVTGAGGPAAIGFMKLAARPDVTMLAADCDPLAPGLFLVPAADRIIVPRGDADDFVEAVLAICQREHIDVLVPTVDVELVPLAQQREVFAAAGITILGSDAITLQSALDKLQLAELCEAHGINVPKTHLVTADTEIPIGSVVKPRSGSGSRGVRIIESADETATVPRDETFLVQDQLPGEELSVDTYVRADGIVIAAVPRTRERVDSGVAVMGRTRRDREAIELASAVAQVLSLRGVANVQLKRDRRGRLAVLEVNPRLPGSLVLTAAAGANLAGIALAEALGEEIPSSLPFREVAMARYLTEIVVELDDQAGTEVAA